MGLHQPHALLAEMRALLNHGLVGAVRKLFIKARPGSQVCYAHLPINGWVGENEYAHGCCLLSTFDLRKWFEPKHAALPESSTPTARYARDTFSLARAGLTCKTLDA